MKKQPFVDKAKVEEIVREYPTPFHLYDEKGIRENIKALKEAFAWNKGYKEYFAVKATPNPYLIDILREYGCGCCRRQSGHGGKTLCFLQMIRRRRNMCMQKS